MKKIMQEVIVVLFIIFAMYLISSSTNTFDTNKSNSLDAKNKKEAHLEKGESSSINSKIDRYTKLKTADRELKMYKICKRNKYVKGVNIKIGDKFIDINTAYASEFVKLKGIGSVLSRRIIDYRNINGLFSKPKDLINVKGIGEKKLDKILNN